MNKYRRAPPLPSDLKTKKLRSGRVQVKAMGLACNCMLVPLCKERGALVIMVEKQFITWIKIVTLSYDAYPSEFRAGFDCESSLSYVGGRDSLFQEPSVS